MQQMPTRLYLGTERPARLQPAVTVPPAAVMSGLQGKPDAGHPTLATSLLIIQPSGISPPTGTSAPKDTAGKTKTANNETIAKIDNNFFIENLNKNDLSSKYNFMILNNLL